MEMVLSMPRMDEHLLLKSVLLLSPDSLLDNIPFLMANGATRRPSDRFDQLRNLHHTCLGLLAIPDNKDRV